MHVPKLCEAVTYILANRGTRAFVNYDEPSIYTAVYNSCLDGYCLYSVDSETGSLDGILLFRPNVRARTLFVDQMICTTPQALKHFLVVFFQLYSGFLLYANRRGRVKLFSEPLLIKLYT